MKEEKDKQKYTIKVDILIPAVLTYQIEAESPKEALEQIERTNKTSKLDIVHSGHKIKIKAKVYKSGTTTLHMTKSYK